MSPSYLWMWLLGAPLVLAVIDLMGTRSARRTHRTADTPPGTARY